MGILGLGFWEFFGNLGLELEKLREILGIVGVGKIWGEKNGKNLGENWEKYGFFEILGLDLWEFWDLEKIGEIFGK